MIRGHQVVQELRASAGSEAERTVGIKGCGETEGSVEVTAWRGKVRREAQGSVGSHTQCT